MSAEAGMPAARPPAVVAAAALLLCAALVLAIGWMLWPEHVVSNGARVFFVMLWATLAYAAFRGFGWVRLAIAAALVAWLWGASNSGALGDAITGAPLPDLAGRAMQMAALALLCLPAARRWLAAVAAHGD